MPVLRRPVMLFTAAAVAAIAVGSLLGIATHSDAAPAPTATSTATAAAVNAKVPTGRPCCGYTSLRPGGSLRSTDPASHSIESGGLGAGADNSLATFTPYRLELQSDGNLVEYRHTEGHDVAMWATGTRSTTPTTLQFQSDGNVVLRNAAGKALWSTGTAGRPAAYFDVYGNGQVVTQDPTGHILSAHGPAQVTSPGTEVNWAITPSFYASSKITRALGVQSDGNLVEYVYSGGSQRAVWSTGTAGVGTVRLVAQSDGNLVLRQVSTGRAVWASGSHGPTAYHQLDLQDDGNLVLYRTDGIRRVQAVWSTGIRR